MASMQQSATCVPMKFKECPAQDMKDARGETHNGCLGKEWNKKKERINSQLTKKLFQNAYIANNIFSDTKNI